MRCFACPQVCRFLGEGVPRIDRISSGRRGAGRRGRTGQDGSQGTAFSGLLPQAAGSIGCRVLGLARLLVFAPMLGPEAFGAVRLAITTSSILAAVGGLGMYTSYLRFMPEARTPRVSGILLRRTATLAVSVSAAAALVLLLKPSLVAHLVFSDSSYTTLAALLAVSIPVTVIYKTAVYAVQGYGDFARSSLAELLQNSVFLAGGVLSLWIVRGSSALCFASMLVGMFAAVLWLIPALAGRSESVPAAASAPLTVPPIQTADPDDSVAVVSPGDVAGAPRDASGTELEQASALVRRAIAYSVWFAMIPVFTYCFDFIDRWMISRYMTLKDAGVYSLVPLLAGGMFFAGASLSSVVCRRGAWLAARGRMRTAHRLVWAGSSLSVFASLAYVLIVKAAEPIIWRVSGPRWSGAAQVLPLSLVYYALYNSYYLLGSFAAFEEKPWVNLAAGLVGVVVNAALNSWWIPLFGIRGAAAGTLAGLLASMAVHALFVQVRGILVPLRAWLTMGLPFMALLPLPLAAAGTVLSALAWKRTSLLSNDSERRIVTVWSSRLSRRTANFIRGRRY